VLEVDEPDALGRGVEEEGARLDVVGVVGKLDRSRRGGEVDGGGWSLERGSLTQLRLNLIN
jgi:hypothetical protein